MVLQFWRSRSKWSRALLPPKVPVLFLTIHSLCNWMAVCIWLLSYVCSICPVFFFFNEISIITAGFTSVIPFSVIYLRENSLKSHTEGLEVRPACILKTRYILQCIGMLKVVTVNTKSSLKIQKLHATVTSISKVFDQNSHQQEIKSDTKCLSIYQKSITNIIPNTEILKFPSQGQDVYLYSPAQCRVGNSN